MTPRTPRLLFGLILLNLAGAASAGSTIYRCGNTYQQAPCSEGRAVDVDDARSDAQRQARDSATAADRRLAHDLAAERREREKSLKPQTQAAGIPVRQLATTPRPADDLQCSKRKKGKGSWHCRHGQPVYVGTAAGGVSV